jgi:predicted GNAT family N-acyltransferase
MQPIEALDRHTIREPDALAAATLLCAIWPKPGRTVDTLAVDLLQKFRDMTVPEEVRPRLFVVRAGQQIIACAQAAPRTIGTSIGDMTVLALARVCTDPAFRGQHLGERVVRAAFDLVDNGSYPFSLFQTGDRVRPFYEKLGCVIADNRFVNSLAEVPPKNPFWDTAIMRYPAGTGWPSGEIDTRGPGW